MTTSAAIIRRRRARKERKQAAAARNRWRIGIITVLVLFLVVIPVGVTLGGALLAYQNVTRSLPTPQESLSQAAMIGLTELYDRSGETLLLADQSSNQRTWLTLNQMPAVLLKATLRAEQPNFLSSERPNVFVAYNRLWENTLFGPLAADQTLTGRLVRSVIAPLPEVPTVDAIGQEIALVTEIGRRYSNEEILEWYLNTADYGNSARGIQSAAQIYLGKDAADLTLDEAAMLAAIPLATQYNPLDNETAARGRQRDLLRSMRAGGDITSAEFDTAATTQTPILLTLNQPEQIAPEFVAYARRQAQDILNNQGRAGTELVARGGLKIITTLDLDLYYQSKCALRIQLARLGGKATSPDADDGKPCHAADYMPVTSLPVDGTAPDIGSVVIMDVTTGEIKSIVGPATRLDAQPGPTLYPFVYFTAFVRAQANPATMVLDIPRKFPGAADGLIYTPTNPDGRFRGPVNLRDAMSAWLLPPAAQIASERGMGTVLSFAHRIGLNSLGEDGRYDLSLLERGGAVSVLDMTYAYSVFAAMGDMHGISAQAVGQGYRQRNPVAVLRIEDEAGNIIWEYDDAQVAQSQVGVFPHDVGYLLNNVLSDQIKRRQVLGDTVSVLDLPRANAVVAGMAGDMTENWTVGYTPQLVASVHLNHTDDTALDLSPAGLDGAALVWRGVMQYAHDRDSLPNADWSRPDTITTLSVCDRSGLIPNADCPTHAEIFLANAGFQPQQEDTYWQKVVINSQSGLRATASTPNQLQISKLFFVPPPDAEEWWRSNNLPLPPLGYDNVSRPELFTDVQLLQPQPYAYVGGQVDIRGTLRPEDMRYFQLSYGEGASPSGYLQIGSQQTTFTAGASLGTWDTTGLSGLYTLLLTVVHQDNSAESATVQVIVDNTPPTVSLSAGEPGKIYRWPTETTLNLSATVGDDYQVQRVEFYRDGEILQTDNDNPYEYTYTITETGTFTFTAVAFDAVGNQTSSSITVEVTRG
ncbi:MAG: penicillin-binding protein [Chloroflexi bacterium]|nr:penicillin-binding protein [Chloroflexota bacterium]MCC6892984.1 transglycosylase domain-containing protein [Anaerolineae bacterium]